MKNYFEPVEFPELESKEEVVVKDPLADPIAGDLERAFLETRRVFAALRTGESNLRSTAVRLVGNDPCMLSFERLRKDPTRPKLKQFIQLCRQDTGLKAAQVILTVFLDIDPTLEGVINI